MPCPTLLALSLAHLALGPAQAPDRAAEAPDRRGLLLAEDGAFAGYTLYAPLKSTNTYLVDMQGEVAHVWRHAFAPGLAVYLLDDGTLIRCSREPEGARFRGGGQGGRVQRVDWEGAVLWDWRCSDDERMQHHDVEPLANGNLLVLAWEQKTRQQALAAGRDPFEVEDDGMWSEVVLEVEPLPPDGARVVWEWHAWDHLVQHAHEKKPDFAPIASRPARIDVNWDVEPDAAELERQQALAQSMRDLGYVGDDPEPASVAGDDDDADDDGGDGHKGRERRDWLHLNSVDHHAALDLVLVGGRHTSEVWVIDHATTSEEARGPKGDLVWRWGRPELHGGSGERTLFGQHDARWIAPADSTDLRFTVFDNGEGRPAGAWSRVLEVLAPVEVVTRTALVPGAIAPGEILWSYAAAPDPTAFYSSFVSGAERLSNGNTLICSGEQGRIFEVTPDGSVVWDYANPHGVELPPALRLPEGDDPPAPDGVFRATRLALDDPAIVALLRAREVGERERAERIRRKREGG